jgi:hypothetical protein
MLTLDPIEVSHLALAMDGQSGTAAAFSGPRSAVRASTPPDSLRQWATPDSGTRRS